MRQFSILPCGFISVALTPRLVIARRRFCDSLRRVPTSRTTLLCARTSRRIRWLIGKIFIWSVHQRTLRVGGMQPRPITLTQNVWSMHGSVTFTVMGRPAARAAARMTSRLRRRWSMTSGDSTSVSLATT